MSYKNTNKAAMSFAYCTSKNKFFKEINTLIEDTYWKRTQKDH